MREIIFGRLFKMKRETALITGSSKGLGENLALNFSKNNYNVILHGRNEQKLEKVKNEILKNKVECYMVSGDIRLDKTLNELTKIAKEKDLSILINNAGIDLESPFQNLSESRLEEVLYTNLISPIKLINQIYPFFLEKKSGTIININSIDGFKAKPLRSIYCASKYGLKGFTDSLRFEAKKNNIRVIGVYPSGMNTDMAKAAGLNVDKCMNTDEVAEIILSCCKSYSSASVDELVINRNRYD